MILGPKDYVIGALVGALVLSGTANWWLFGERDGGIAQLAQVNGALTTANDANAQCERSVKTLEDEAKTAQAQAKPKIEAAAAKNKDHVVKAQAILSTPASVPSDVCASAQDRAAAWLKDRP